MQIGGDEDADDGNGGAEGGGPTVLAGATRRRRPLKLVCAFGAASSKTARGRPGPAARWRSRRR